MWIAPRLIIEIFPVSCTKTCGYCFPYSSALLTNAVYWGLERDWADSCCLIACVCGGMRDFKSQIHKFCVTMNVSNFSSVKHHV